ncbi:MAG: hypothetical protein ACHRHE_14730 [Tepidisphaerales bacterium]
MSLSEWYKNGWLKAHETTAQEIADLLALAARDLQDCQRAQGLSDDWRFSIAYNAALQASCAALAASGYAVPKGDSNHYRVIQSLAFTIGLTPKEIDALDGYRKKRSMSIYDAAGVISDAEAKRIVPFAASLVTRISQWLRDEHPELMRSTESATPKTPRR